MPRTTVALDESLLLAIRTRAAEQGKSMSRLVNELLHRALNESPKPPDRDLARRWRTFEGGRPRVSVADREALFSVMEPEP